MPNRTDIDAIVEGLSEAQKRGFLEAEAHDDGETYACVYSVPDRFTKSYLVYGRGDPLNRLGLSVRSALLEARERQA